MRSAPKSSWTQAIAWWRKAADHGSQGAETALGSAFERAHGVDQNYAQAAYWYRKAADQGNAFGLLNLGAMASQGHGVPADEIEAYKWSALAVARAPDWSPQARDRAARNRDASQARLTPAQLAEAKARVAAWLASHPNLPPP